MNTRAKGNIAEQKAIEFLKKNNFKIIKTNFYTKFGEIDIIAFKNNVFHFIEVKSGKSFEPIFNITPKKIQKIIKTAQLFMKKNSINSAFCIDAIIIKDDIEFIENITF